jgi:flagellar hook assembly protein FlgD
MPAIITLSQNTPNPVTNSTVISFNLASLPNAQNAKLQIYNIRGQMVREFALEEVQGEIHWDRTDSYGNKVGSGIYLYKLSTGKDSFVKKMVVLD